MRGSLHSQCMSHFRGIFSLFELTIVALAWGKPKRPDAGSIILFK